MKMKKILFALLMLTAFFKAESQVQVVSQPQYFNRYIKVRDSVRASEYYQNPNDTLATQAYARSHGGSGSTPTNGTYIKVTGVAQVNLDTANYRKQDSTYIPNDTTITIKINGVPTSMKIRGGVWAFNGRTGYITPSGSDYSAYYVSLSGSYANPTWITSIPFSKISSTPSTLGGYGILNGVVNAGGGYSYGSGTFASRPAAGNAGAEYIATDSLQLFYDNGSSWGKIAGGSGGADSSVQGYSGILKTLVGTNIILKGDTSLLATRYDVARDSTYNSATFYPLTNPSAYINLTNISALAGGYLSYNNSTGAMRADTSAGKLATKTDVANVTIAVPNLLIPFGTGTSIQSNSGFSVNSGATQLNFNGISLSGTAGLQMIWNTTGSIPTAPGTYFTLFGPTNYNTGGTGTHVSIFGSNNGPVMTNGNNVAFVGSAGLQAATSASRIAAVGDYALGNITTGSNFAMLGTFAGRYFNTTSTNDIVVGTDSTSTLTVVNNFTFIGHGLKNANMRNNAAIFGRENQLVNLGNGGGNTAAMNSFTPQAGDVFFNTDSASGTGSGGYCVYNGTYWVKWGGGGSGTSLPITDNVSLLKNLADGTKQAIFNLSNIPTATVNTYYLPAAAGTLMTNLFTSTGDLLYASSGSTAARLPIGGANAVLKAVSGVPTWVSDTTYWTSGINIRGGDTVELGTQPFLKDIHLGGSNNYNLFFDSMKVKFTGPLYTTPVSNDTANYKLLVRKPGDSTAYEMNWPFNISATYTPTLTNTLNIASSTLQTASYSRNGNIVHVNIGVLYTPTASGTATTLTVSLPITATTGTQTYVGLASFGEPPNILMKSGIVTVNSTTTATVLMYPGSTNGQATNIQFDYKLN